MIHISPWSATEGLMAGAGRVLTEAGKLFLYGPYLEAEVPTAPSNLAFDESLRSRNPAWGLGTSPRWWRWPPDMGSRSPNGSKCRPTT